jgi:hypothetical protein
MVQSADFFTLRERERERERESLQELGIVFSQFL